MSEPSISIVIATYRRQALLTDCLQSLAQQSYPRDRFEVIVVDDYGDLDKAALRAALESQLDPLVLSHKHSGPAGARNMGVTRARGQWVYFTDDDCWLHPDSLTRLWARLERHPTAAIVGACAAADLDNTWSLATQAQIDAVASFFNRDTGRATYGATSNLAVPTSLFRALGGLDTDFRISEDREFLDRWVRNGHPLVYAPEIVVVHRHPCTLRELLLRNVGYGRGARQFARTRRAQQVAEPSFEPGFYRHLFTHPLRAGYPRKLRVLAGVLVARSAYAFGYLTAHPASPPGMQPSGRPAC